MKIEAVEQRIARSISAPPSSQAPQDDLKTIALLTARVKELTEQLAAKDQQLAASNGERDTWHRLADIERERGDFYAEASKLRRDAGGISDQIVEQYKQQLARADSEIERQRAEINRLRNPGFFRRVFNPDTAFKVLGGVAIGRATCPN